jgi:molybdopterin-containing oxidoreductase family membrane subunit
VFHPTWVDIWTYIGTIGIFTSLFLIFIRFLPMIAMSEVKTAVPEADPHYGTPPGVQSVSPGGKERTR